MVLIKVSADLDTEHAKTEASRQEYLNKMRVHTVCAEHTLSLDKMFGEKVLLDEEWDRALREAVLMEAQVQGLNPRDNREELMELIELRRHKVERVTEVGQLVVLVRDISKDLMDLGKPPNPGITGDVLEAVGTILEHLREAHASRHSPWD
jgi:hypothetical protein